MGLEVELSRRFDGFGLDVALGGLDFEESAVNRATRRRLKRNHG